MRSERCEFYVATRNTKWDNGCMATTQPAIGPLLRQLREAAGLTVRRLAELSGVDQANISRLETGQATKPTFESLTKLAEALDADPARFYKAAGASTKTTLPSLRPYLRAKYSHLPASSLDEVAAFFERIEAEQAAKRRTKSASESSTKTTGTKGGHR